MYLVFSLLRYLIYKYIIFFFFAKYAVHFFWTMAKYYLNSNNNANIFS